MKRTVVSGPRLHSGGCLLDLQHMRDVVGSIPEAYLKHAHCIIYQELT